MTRWARQHAARSRGVLQATPWEKMVDGAPKGSAKAGPGRGSRPLHLQREPGGKKKNRKKKEYMNEDVNGFLEHVRQSAQGGLVLAAHDPEVRAEVAMALKKDQRREERRLKRQEKRKHGMVCFHCRKPGHGIADCPAALENQDMGTGICYRCGSTEHEISKCKAKIDPAVGEFPFAKCFICGEMGHLSRSCPDNPKGLYAEGGCCRLCGSVEHFKKDCRENQNSDQVTVGRWSRGMSADHEDILESPKPQKTKVKVPKVVNF